jgi:hypothetical protein
LPGDSTRLEPELSHLSWSAWACAALYWLNISTVGSMAAAVARAAGHQGSSKAPLCSSSQAVGRPILLLV